MSSSKKYYLTIVSPVYRAESIVNELVLQIEQGVKDITSNYQIILIDDGSPDKSWDEMQKVALLNTKVKAIKLSRNFGQHYAITCGLEECDSQWVVVMDCDLQDRPDQIIKLYQKAKEGYDLVFAQRVERQDGFFKRLWSKLFYGVYSYLTDTEQDASIANFGIYNAKVVQAVLSMNDAVRYFPTMSQWVGFSKVKVPVEHGKRHSGKTTYSIRKLWELAFNNIISFSEKPLWLTVKAGFIISILAVLYGVFFIIKYFVQGVPVVGYTSILVSIWFLSGIIILTLGIVGSYIGKTFEKVKGRPSFIIDEIIND